MIHNEQKKEDSAVFMKAVSKSGTPWSAIKLFYILDLNKNILIPIPEGLCILSPDR